MQYFPIKKTLLGLVVMLLCLSFTLTPVMANQIDSEGGNFVNGPEKNTKLYATQTVIFGEHATWKYFDKGKLPAANWFATSFNDGTWTAGSAVLGYGNGSERTVVSYGSTSTDKYISTYFRKTFSLTAPSAYSKISMTLLVDDGAVVFLNGKEIYRINMPTGSVGFATTALSSVLQTVIVNINPGLFVTGNNNLSVEIHQWDNNSSDIAFSLSLTGESGISVTPTTPPQPTNTATLLPPTATPTKPAATNTPLPPTATPPAMVTPTVAPTIAPTIPPTTGKAFYVTTSGSSSNDGTSGHPWSLSYALGQPSGLKAGDTVWVRGGTYNGSFSVNLSGSSSAPITIRAYPGERVILSNSTSYNMDIQNAAYVNFWGLEITQSYSTRTSSRSESTYGIRVNQGNTSHHIKFINMIIHDVQSQGIGWWQALSDSEVYGTLFYFNGTTELDHGIYVNNMSGTKWFIDNIVNDSASHGFHGYTTSSTKGLNNFYLDGNTFFNNGSIGYTTSKGTYGTYKRNILTGGEAVAKNPVVMNNCTYYPGSSGTSYNLGYNAGSSNAKVTNNYFMGGNMVFGGTNSGVTMTGNTVYAPGGLSGFSQSSFTNNNWLSAKPTGLKTCIRPNKYEPNRANVTIYNWDKQSTIKIPAASLSGITLIAGDRYELHNAQNYFGDVVSGVFDGSSLNVPMTGRTVGQPTGLSFKPASTFPEFGAFVMIVIGK
jgi:hypothetical protein